MKLKSEINHFFMANRILASLPADGPQLYRLFLVYHPVYEVGISIDSYDTTKSYHMIEQYMDKLVCGYRGSQRELAEGVFILSENELYELMGLDKEAYEIAGVFFRDLVAAGHFSVQPDGSIRAEQPARESVKSQEKHIASTVRMKKLFDQLSVRLLPQEFYDSQRFAFRGEDVADGTENAPPKAVWIRPRTTGANVTAELQQMLGNHSYTAEEGIACGLPNGFRGMSVDMNEEAELTYIPYFLAVFKDRSGQLSFRAYRRDNGKPLPWIGEQYQSAEYRDARVLLQSLCEYRETKGTVFNPLLRKCRLSENGVPARDEGVTLDTDGNYIWTLTDQQVRDLTQDDPRPGICRRIARNRVSCLDSYDAGKLVYLRMTPAQREKLLKAAGENAD